MLRLFFITSLALLGASFLLGSGHYWVALYLVAAGWLATFLLLCYSPYFIDDDDDTYISYIKPHYESSAFHLVLLFFAFTMGKAAVWPGLVGLGIVSFLFQEQLTINPFFVLSGLYFYDCISEQGNGFVLISTEIIKSPCHVTGLQRLSKDIYLHIVPSSE